MRQVQRACETVKVWLKWCTTFNFENGQVLHFVLVEVELSICETLSTFAMAPSIIFVASGTKLVVALSAGLKDLYVYWFVCLIVFFYLFSCLLFCLFFLWFFATNSNNVAFENPPGNTL